MGAVAIGAILDAAECSVSASKTIRTVLGAFVTGEECPTTQTATRREEVESLMMADYQAPEGGSREAVLLEAMVPHPDLCNCCVHHLKQYQVLRESTEKNKGRDKSRPAVHTPLPVMKKVMDSTISQSIRNNSPFV